MKRLGLVVILLSTILDAKCARILAVFPTPSLSHQLVFRPVTQELAKRGHEVVVITPDPAFPKGETPKNFTEIDVHEVAYRIWRNILERHLTVDPNDTFSTFKGMVVSVIDFFSGEMENKEVKEIIEKKKGDFDLLITELCVRPSLGFTHIYRVPLIQFSSFGAILDSESVIGAAKHPILYPRPFGQRFYNLTMWEKINELYNSWLFDSFYQSREDIENDRMKLIFGSDVPPLSELRNNIHMTMLNVNPIWVDNQPMPPNVVYLGGLHQKPPMPLPSEIQSYLDSSTNGVIYVSFGTNVIPSILPVEVKHALWHVLSEMPYDVLLKWNTEEIPSQYKNIKQAKWFPQADLLRHSKVKLFVTQGGLQSVDEAISSGVPMVGIPFFGDQWYNTEKIVHHKIGTKLDLDKFTTETLRNAIETVVNNKSYRDNIRDLHKKMTDQPQTSLERSIWWIEYVLRHGGAKHLRPPTANMSLYEYLEMDLVLCVISILLLGLTLISFAMYIIYKYIRRTFLKYDKIKSS